MRYKVREFINEIARASKEQSDSVSQIKIGADQIADVIQNNSATAEESAAASEELSSQAQLLKTSMEQFRLQDSVRRNLDEYINTQDNTSSQYFRNEGSKY